MEYPVADNDANQAEDIQQYLSFMMGGKTYGLEITDIKEILQYGDLTDVPMTPDFISGVINLRGRIVPVVDLSLRFAGKATGLTKRTSIIILEIQNEDLRLMIGLTVDMVNEVLDIHPSEIEPSPSLGKQIKTNFIKGMAKINDKLLVLLNIEKVLTIDEISQVGSIQI
jgi:purine-binding chemotaxis protein CheW